MIIIQHERKRCGRDCDVVDQRCHQRFNWRQLRRAQQALRGLPDVPIRPHRSEGGIMVWLIIPCMVRKYNRG
jgi:hypothetical protein